MMAGNQPNGEMCRVKGGMGKDLSMCTVKVS
jgi:hypothetical protein